MRLAAALTSLTLLALWSDGAVARADPAGIYVRATPAPGRLTIAPAGGSRWRVSLSAAGRPDGAATGADCQLESEGALQGDRIRAKDVEVRLAADTARVISRYQGCGVGVDLNGSYRREGTGPLAAGADLAQARAAYPGTRLKIVEGYPWARFAVLRAGKFVATLTFDGENEELADGSNSFRRIGQTVDWSALKPGLKVTRIEGSRR